jgi:hypothetical protein
MIADGNLTVPSIIIVTESAMLAGNMRRAIENSSHTYALFSLRVIIDILLYNDELVILVDALSFSPPLHAMRTKVVAKHLGDNP